MLMAKRDKSVRHEMTRADLAKRGIVAVLVVLVVLGLLAIKQKGIIGGPPQVTAEVANAGGSLANGSDVKVHGIIVGQVAAIKPGPHGDVDVTLAMNGSDLSHIPSNVVARILPATVFGNSFVDLVTHGQEAPSKLQAGATVPADRTQGTLELQKGLDDIDSLVKALNPSQLDSTLSAISMTLDGHGAEIGSIIRDLDAFLQKFDPKLPLIRSDLSKLSANMTLLQQVAPQILHAIHNSLPVLHTITSQRQALATLLKGGRQVADQANTFLKGVQPSLVKFIDNALIVETVYYDLRHEAFANSFAVIRELRAKLGSVVRHGWANVVISIITHAPPYYTNADCPQFGSAHGYDC